MELPRLRLVLAWLTRLDQTILLLLMDVPTLAHAKL
jgi:hypothetical protein